MTRFHEEMHPGYGQFLDPLAVVHRERTAHQDLTMRSVSKVATEFHAK